MQYELFMHENILSFGNSLLYPSGMEIACISCVVNGKRYWVSLQTQGNVCIYYKNKVYKNISQFSDELLQHLKNNDYEDLILNGEMQIDERNWWEFCYSNGDGCVLDCEPKDYKCFGNLVNELIVHLKNMLQESEYENE